MTRWQHISVGHQKMNLILYNSKYVNLYTYLDPIFDAVPEFANFYYLVTDLECCGSDDERLSGEPVVISGFTLHEIIQKDEVQFIWGVFSAFNREPSIPTELPSADGNSKFWEGSPTPQIKNAMFEIVCWDSTATLFIGIDHDIAAKLKVRYPDILDLDQENGRRG